MNVKKGLQPSASRLFFFVMGGGSGSFVGMMMMCDVDVELGCNAK